MFVPPEKIKECDYYRNWKSGMESPYCHSIKTIMIPQVTMSMSVSYYDLLSHNYSLYLRIIVNYLLLMANFLTALAETGFRSRGPTQKRTVFCCEFSCGRSRDNIGALYSAIQFNCCVSQRGQRLRSDCRPSHFFVTTSRTAVSPGRNPYCSGGAQPVT